MKPSVAVIRGGRGGEAEISRLSGASVRDALVRAGHRVVDVVIDPEGRWSFGGGGALPVASAVAELVRCADVVFPVLHGPFGEDGTLQGMLETVEIPYVGSGVCASALAMDKVLARKVAGASGIRVAAGVEGGPDRGDAEVARIARAAASLALPLFVKPACSGSSVGVTRVDRAPLLAAAIAKALAEGGRVVVEEGVTGVEVSCPVVGDAYGDRRALPPIAIVPRGHDFFDYQAKYTPGHCDEICPAPVSADRTREVQRLACEIHDLFGCRSLSRSDFILPERGAAVFLEINTMPGMSPLSLVPKAIAAAGESFDEVVSGWCSAAHAKRTGAAGASAR